MKTMEWLKSKAPGFKHLSEDERNAIADFSLLWSLFESRILNTRGNVDNICQAVERWHSTGTLNADAFDTQLAYFQERYYDEGRFTQHFRDLNLKNPDLERFVSAVIDSSDDDARSRMKAVLIIAFRYRNNLFHGVKWQYNLAGQLDNFTAANAILMKVLEQHGALTGV